MPTVRSSREKVRRHREGAGARVVPGPDLGARHAVSGLRGGSLAPVAASEHANEDQAFVDAISVEWP